MNSFKYCTPDSTLLSTNIWNTMNCYITVVLHGNDNLFTSRNAIGSRKFSSKRTCTYGREKTLE